MQSWFHSRLIDGMQRQLAKHVGFEAWPEAGAQYYAVGIDSEGPRLLAFIVSLGGDKPVPDAIYTHVYQDEAFEIARRFGVDPNSYRFHLAPASSSATSILRSGFGRIIH